MQLVLVKISTEQKEIYYLTDLLGLQVLVETERARPEIGQCFNCQKFGHAQSRCTAVLKCVSCGGEHRAFECTLPREQLPNCASSGKAHPASYRGCPKFPRLKTPTSKTNNNQDFVAPNKGYSTVVTANNVPTTPSAWPKIRTNRTPRSARTPQQQQNGSISFTDTAGNDFLTHPGIIPISFRTNNQRC